MKFIYYVYVRFFTPLIWKLFANKQQTTIRKFSQIELDSCWQLMQAIPSFKDDKAKAFLFGNALEELSHGKMFEKEYYRNCQKLPAFEIANRKNLLKANPNKSDLCDFLMFFHLGETAVCEKFRWLAEAPLEESLKKTFLKIVSDETGHGSSCLSLIRDQGMSESEIFRMKLINKYLRLKDIVLQFGRRMDTPIFVVLNIFYYVFGVFVSRPLQKRFSMDRSEQLKILQSQVAEHAGSIRGL